MSNSAKPLVAWASDEARRFFRAFHKYGTEFDKVGRHGKAGDTSVWAASRMPVLVHWLVLTALGRGGPPGSFLVRWPGTARMSLLPPGIPPAPMDATSTPSPTLPRPGVPCGGQRPEPGAVRGPASPAPGLSVPGQEVPVGDRVHRHGRGCQPAPHEGKLFRCFLGGRGEGGKGDEKLVGKGWWRREVGACMPRVHP